MFGAQNHSAAGSPPSAQRLRRLAHRQPLLLIAAAAVAGVLLDALLGGTGRAWGTLWIVLVATGVAAIIGRRGSIRRSATVLVFLPVAALLHDHQEDSYQSATVLTVAAEIDEPAILEGMVDLTPVLRRHPLADQPGRRNQSPWQTHIELRLQRLRVGRRFEPFSGRVLLIVNGRRDQLRPGDVVRVYGAMRRFTPPTNPGQRDSRASYRIRRLHARVEVDSEDQVVLIAIASHPLGLCQIRRMIASVAMAGRDGLLRHTTPQAGPLAVALVIGQRDFVDAETRDLLLVTGTAHLLSVSGLHLAIVVVLGSWTATLFRLPSVARIFWILAICCLYTAITGSRPPVMRASVLVSTFMFAIWIKRPSQPINTLSLAALILLAINPECVFSIGVQLSFLAVTTLVLCGHRRGENSAAAEQAIRQEEQLRLLVEGTRSRPVRYLKLFGRYLWRLSWFSGCVTAISLPLVWHEFHVVSPISVVTNVVLGPFLFLSLASGVATVIMAFLLDPLAVVPGLICDGSLRVMRWLIETAASIPWGHFWLPSPPTWWVAAYYVVLAATLLWHPGRSASFARYGWIAAWILIAWILATATPRLNQGNFEATFVDVGHGTSVVLRFSGDDVWLYDCGRLGNDSNSSRDIDATLWSLGVTRLRGVFLSHADADHFNALPGVLRRFAVDQILTPPGMLDDVEPAVMELRRAIDASGTEVREIASGEVLTLSGHTR